MPDWDKIFGQLAAVNNAPIPFFVSLFVAIGIIWWLINWKYNSVIGHRDAEISNLKAERDEYKGKITGVTPDQAKTKTETLAKVAPPAQSRRLISGACIEWRPDGRISLQGRFSISGGPLNIYVTYGSPHSAPGRYRSLQQVIGGTLNVESRIKLGTIVHFDREEKTDFTLGFVSDVEGHQQIIQWGELAQDNIKVGITWGSYFGWIIFVWDEGKIEEWYPFAIVSTVQPNAVGVPPLFIAPDILMSHSALQKK
jgi:hypothetical protein